MVAGAFVAVQLSREGKHSIRDVGGDDNRRQINRRFAMSAKKT